MKRFLIFMIRIYQTALTPFLAPACRFTPHCSAYSIEAITRYGALRGSGRTLMRLLRCHPFHPGGYDPVATDSGSPVI